VPSSVGADGKLTGGQYRHFTYPLPDLCVIHFKLPPARGWGVARGKR
jgi:hypothetical protein